ncbi:GNAT family N-acetyltransferase [Fusobacterium sp. PH5-44]|uniref:GNAT family N-acetyltransferase n=1 Tax=unclassified Fusobacterium TaxID=2648384 RepID=UPI003D1AC6FB
MGIENVGTREVNSRHLSMRQFTYDDSQSMKENWISDPEVQKMYFEPVYTTKEEINGLLKKYVNSYETDNYYRWAITLRGSKECIGQIAYFLVDEKNHWGEIEYCIGQRFQNKGYITEALEAIINYGFDQIKFHKIQVCHMSNNPKSARVIEKIGFIYDGKLRDYFFMNGQYISRLYYSLLESEWNKIRS